MTKKIKRHTPVKGGADYRRAWRLADGAVRDCMRQHPEYLTDADLHQARLSLVKRVAGTMTGWATEAARGRSGKKPAAE